MMMNKLESMAIYFSCNIYHIYSTSSNEHLYVYIFLTRQFYSLVCISVHRLLIDKHNQPIGHSSLFMNLLHFSTYQMCTEWVILTPLSISPSTVLTLNLSIWLTITGLFITQMCIDRQFFLVKISTLRRK